MFTYLRYFYIVSFVLIIAAAIGSGITIRSIVADDLEMVVKRNSLVLAQSFINSVWKDYTDNKLSRSELSRNAGKFAGKLSLAKMNVYGADGSLLYSSSRANIQTSAGEKPYLFDLDNVHTGMIGNRVLENAILSEKQNNKYVTLVQTLKPIINPKYDPSSTLCKIGITSSYSSDRAKELCSPTAGIIEIFFDVTPQWKRIDTIQYIVVGGIVGIFLLLISMLLLTTKRAEAIISKQHEVNLELTAAAASAEAENRDKSQFLASVSHELRTPLNAIIGFSEIIKNEAMANLNDTHQEYVKDIHSSGKHLLSLINDILDFSKAEAGKLEVDCNEIDASKLIKNSMRLVIPRAEEAQVTLVEDLPPEHIVMTTDGKKLKQVLLNLLSNAVKFTPAGGQVKVTAWEQLLEDMVCFEVSDTGIGIAPKDISKVMTPFGQADNTLARKYEGTGLGLPLAKKFVEIMGGSFNIESEVNVGTTITIKLPKVFDPKNKSAKALQHEQADPAAPQT